MRSLRYNPNQKPKNNSRSTPPAADDWSSFSDPGSSSSSSFDSGFGGGFDDFGGFQGAPSGGSRPGPRRSGPDKKVLVIILVIVLLVAGVVAFALLKGSGNPPPTGNDPVVTANPSDTEPTVPPVGAEPTATPYDAEPTVSPSGLEPTSTPPSSEPTELPFVFETQSPEDVQSHFEAMGTVVGTADAATSPANLSGKDVLADFTARGFTRYATTASMTPEGTVIDSVEMTAETETRYPKYETIYVSANRDIWFIYNYGGTVMAQPYLHTSLDPESEIPVYLSETDNIMCYDYYYNRFYEVRPDPAVITLVKVSRIDADTLEHWTMGGND